MEDYNLRKSAILYNNPDLPSKYKYKTPLSNSYNKMNKSACFNDRDYDANTINYHASCRICDDNKYPLKKCNLSVNNLALTTDPIKNYVTKIINLERENTTLKLELSNIKNKNEENRSTINNLRETLVFNNKVDHNKAHEFEHIILKKNEIINENSKNLNQLIADNNELNNLISTLNVKIDNLAIENDNLRKEKNNIINENLSKCINLENINIDNITKINDLIKKLEDSKDINSKLENQLEHYKYELLLKNEEINKLNNIIDNNNLKDNSNKAKISILENNISELTNKLSNNEYHINDYKEKYDKINKLYNESVSKYNTLYDNYKETKSKLDYCDKIELHYNELKDYNNNTLVQLSNKDIEIKKMKEEINGLNNELYNLKKSKEYYIEIENKYNELVVNYNNNINNYLSNSKNVDELNNTVDKYKKIISYYEDEINTLKRSTLKNSSYMYENEHLINENQRLKSLLDSKSKDLEEKIYKNDILLMKIGLLSTELKRKNIFS